MFYFKPIKITNRKTETLTSSVDTYVVKWNSNIYDWGHHGITTRYQVFTDKEEAKKFKKSLDQANKLLKNDYATCVCIEKQKTGL